jgi:GT2 family glycosyltransferase
VIVPSLDGRVQQIEEALHRQTWQPAEVHVSVNIRPNGRARNQGVLKTTSEYLVFIDDDAVPGTNDLIEKLVCRLMDDPSVGITGCARVLPKESPWFQRRVAAEIPRTVNEIPKNEIETNPPLNGYGHSLITTTCCAVRRQVFEEAGMFSEALTSGVDTDFFYRIRKLGYRFVMVPDTYVEHPAPASLKSLWKKFQWYGVGYGQEAQKRPEQKIGPRLDSPLKRMLFRLAVSLWFIPNIFVLYSYGYPRFELGFRPIKAFSTYAVAMGYIKSWSRGIQMN